MNRSVSHPKLENQWNADGEMKVKPAMRSKQKQSKGMNSVDESWSKRDREKVQRVVRQETRGDLRLFYQSR
jgi:hypothetical protein